MIETEELTKQYGSLTALNECSISVPSGEVFGLRILVGMVRPTSGAATISGLDSWRQSLEVRRITSYLPGDARMFRWHRGADVLKLLSLARGTDPSRALGLAERLQLDLRRRVAMMSTGMRQKLALAAVLAADCAVLILDEPTANLDPSVRMEVLQLVRESQRRGQTILFSSHVLSEVEEVCDRVLLLRYGEVAHLQDMTQLRKGHRIWLDASTTLPKLPDDLTEHLTIDRQGDRWRIDTNSCLTQTLRWLAQTELQSLRIEPIGLRTVYEEHFGALAVDDAEETTDPSAASNGSEVNG